MENVKDLFSALRKGLENFSAHITHSSQIYQRKTKDLTPEAYPNGQDSPMDRSARPAEEMITTMGSAIDNFIDVMLEMAKDVKTKADLMFRELIEPSDTYCKHYQATNNVLIE